MCQARLAVDPAHLQLCNATVRETGENFNPAPIYAVWWKEYTQARDQGVFERVLLYDIEGIIVLASPTIYYSLYILEFRKHKCIFIYLSENLISILNKCCSSQNDISILKLADPNESTDLAPSMPALSEYLLNKLKSYIDQETFPMFPPPLDPNGDWKPVDDNQSYTSGWCSKNHLLALRQQSLQGIKVNSSMYMQVLFENPFQISSN